MPALLNRDILDQTFAGLGLAAVYTGPWIRTDGFSQVAIEWVSTGGATITAAVEESFDGVSATADRTTAAGAAGANGPAVPTQVPISLPFCRMKLTDSVAAAATLKASMKATG